MQQLPKDIKARLLLEITKNHPSVKLHDIPALFYAFELGIVYALHKDIPEKKICKLLDKGE